MEEAQKSLSLPFADIAELLRQARYLDGQGEFAEYRARRLAEISNEKHAPVLLDHGSPTDYVVVITHGLYDSPDGQKDLAKLLHDKGMNVIMPLLPGHWSKDPTKLDRVTFKDFIREEKRAIDMAKKMGKKVILAGHSTGGLLAVNAALSDKSIAGLVLMAPAIQLNKSATLLAHLGGAIDGFNANFFMQKDPDPIFTPYYSGNAGNELVKLSEDMHKRHGYEPPIFPDHDYEQAFKRQMYGKIKAPVITISAGVDIAVDNEEVDTFMASVRGPRKFLQANIFSHSEVGHIRNPKGSAPKDKAYRSLWNSINQFLDKNLTGLSEAK